MRGRWFKKRRHEKLDVSPTQNFADVKVKCKVCAKNIKNLSTLPPRPLPTPPPPHSPTTHYHLPPHPPISLTSWLGSLATFVINHWQSTTCVCVGGYRGPNRGPPMCDEMGGGGGRPLPPYTPPPHKLSDRQQAEWQDISQWKSAWVSPPPPHTHAYFKHLPEGQDRAQGKRTMKIRGGKKV